MILDMEGGINPEDAEKAEDFFYELEDAFSHASARQKDLRLITAPGRDYEGFPPVDDLQYHCQTALRCAGKLHSLSMDVWERDDIRPPSLVNLYVYTCAQRRLIFKEAVGYIRCLREAFEETMSPDTVAEKQYDSGTCRGYTKQLKRIVSTYNLLHHRGIV